MARSPDPAVRIALVEAAARILAEDGLDALSIRKVAATVDSSTMAVYTHFGSKDDLVAEVVLEAFTRLNDELRAVESTDDPVADLIAVGRAYRRTALSNPHLYRVMFGLNPLAFTDPSELEAGERDVALDAFDAMVSAVARCVDAGILLGEPRPVALELWATAHGAVSLELAGFLTAHAEATFDRALAHLFIGLSANEGRA